jgi:hypothetical protein
VSNYPQSVSGNEYQIAGADREWEANFPCDQCQAIGTFTMQEYAGNVWGNCDVCGAELDDDLIEHGYNMLDYLEPDCWD